MPIIRRRARDNTSGSRPIPAPLLLAALLCDGRGEDQGADAAILYVRLQRRERLVQEDLCLNDHYGNGHLVGIDLLPRRHGRREALSGRGKSTISTLARSHPIITSLASCPAESIPTRSNPLSCRPRARMWVHLQPGVERCNYPRHQQDRNSSILSLLCERSI
jgi:hypothetical protein